MKISCKNKVHNKITAIFITFAATHILKFQRLVTCQKGLDKQCRLGPECFRRSSLISVLAVFNCYSDKHFVNSSLDNQHLCCEKRVRNFRTFTELNNSAQARIFLLVNLGEIYFRFRLGGMTKKSSENYQFTSWSFSELFFFNQS